MTPATCDEPQPPAIPGLTAMQSAFVHEMLADARCQRRAAIRAGYSRASAHVTASRLMRHPLVAKAILEGSAVLLAGSAAEAVQTTRTLMRAAKSELVREKAAGSILDRVGLNAPQHHKVSGSLSFTIDLSGDAG